jgi:hypothetical protein
VVRIPQREAERAARETTDRETERMKRCTRKRGREIERGQERANARASEREVLARTIREQYSRENDKADIASRKKASCCQETRGNRHVRILHTHKHYYHSISRYSN